MLQVVIDGQRSLRGLRLRSQHPIWSRQPPPHASSLVVLLLTLVAAERARSSAPFSGGHEHHRAVPQSAGAVACPCHFSVSFANKVRISRIREVVSSSTICSSVQPSNGSDASPGGNGAAFRGDSGATSAPPSGIIPSSLRQCQASRHELVPFRPDALDAVVEFCAGLPERSRQHPVAAAGRRVRRQAHLRLEFADGLPRLPHGLLVRFRQHCEIERG